MENHLNKREWDDLYADLSKIISGARKRAYQTVDYVLVLRNWMIGKRISEEELKGERSERYGMQIIDEVSKKLTREQGKGFDRRSLYRYVQFYRYFPEIVPAAAAQSSDNDINEIVAAPMAQSEILPWTSYRALLQVKDERARNWYAREAYGEAWSSRTLQRNISSQYYYRVLKTQDPVGVKKEMQEITAPYQDKLEYMKNPIIAEFLGMEQAMDYHESDLETAIINNLQKFLMELGKGYAFVARQQHIHTEKEDYYIDLVFYNYILKCFVLIDLKTRKITHQDVGQMDMYIRMYDEMKKRLDDNPTLGILLCSDTDEDIARYSVMHGNEQLFASKYKLYLPSEQELREEIEEQKYFFKIQQQNGDGGTD